MPTIDKTALPSIPTSPIEASTSLCLSCCFGFCTTSKALGGNKTDVRCMHPAREDKAPNNVVECDGHIVGDFDPVNAFNETVQKALALNEQERPLDEVLDELEAESDELEGQEQSQDDKEVSA